MEMFLLTIFGIIILFSVDYFFENNKKKNNQYNLYYKNDLYEFCEKNNYTVDRFFGTDNIKHIALFKYHNGKKILRPLYKLTEYSENHRYLENELRKGEILQYKIIDKPMNFKFQDPLYSPD